MQFMVLEKFTGPDYTAVFIPRKLTRKIRYTETTPTESAYCPKNRLLWEGVLLSFSKGWLPSIHSSILTVRASVKVLLASFNASWKRLGSNPAPWGYQAGRIDHYVTRPVSVRLCQSRPVKRSPFNVTVALLTSQLLSYSK